METYILAERNLCHLDLYRLGGMEELEMLGIRDYLDSNWNLWIEWPDHAQPLAQQADLDMDFDYTGIGRTVTMVGQSERGSALVEELK
jgi:tRNA threonylcarbamoyladenosine biosynthesis protein TsaE